MCAIAITHALVIATMPVLADVTMCVHVNALIHVHATATMVHLVVHVMFTSCVHASAIIPREHHVHVTTTHIVNVMCDMVQAVVAQRFAVATAQLVDVLHILHMRVPLMVHHNHKRGHVHVTVIIRLDFLIKIKRLDKL